MCTRTHGKSLLSPKCPLQFKTQMPRGRIRSPFRSQPSISNGRPKFKDSANISTPCLTHSLSSSLLHSLPLQLKKKDHVCPHFLLKSRSRVFRSLISQISHVRQNTVSSNRQRFQQFLRFGSCFSTHLSGMSSIP